MPGALFKGTVQAILPEVNPGTRTLKARVELANPRGELVPGMFVSLKIGSGMINQALLVPERAIGNDQNKKFIYIVGDNNKVAYREIALGQQVGARRIVLSGLHEGERVVIDGLQHIAPDVTVQATEKPALASTAASQ